MTLKALIDEYKFGHKQEAAGHIVRLLDSRLPLLDVDMIVPIPTDPAHIRQRGFAHMEMIAKALARKRQLPAQLLLRRVRSGTQHHKSIRNRRKFADASLSLVGNVSGRRVLLIDDIYTTGATVHSAVRLLCEAGAETVMVAIVARQPLD